MSAIDASMPGSGWLFTSELPASVPARQRALGVSHLSREEIEGLRQDLLDQRGKLAADIARLQNESGVGSGFGAPVGYSLAPGTAGDSNGQTWERTLRLSSIAAKRSLLYEIDQALARIDNDTYGICTDTKQAISLDRLREIPWARST